MYFNGWKVNEECTVAFQKWKATVAKWEFEDHLKGLLEQVLSILLSINRNEEWFYMTAGDALNREFIFQ